MWNKLANAFGIPAGNSFQQAQQRAERATAEVLLAQEEVLLAQHRLQYAEARAAMLLFRLSTKVTSR